MDFAAMMKDPNIMKMGMYMLGRGIIDSCSAKHDEQSCNDEHDEQSCS